MEREKVIELVIKADEGFQFDPDDMYESLIGIDAVIRFARLVEQETLERAAKAVEAVGRVDMSIDGVSFYATTGLCAKAIRDLKDNHDKE